MRARSPRNAGACDARDLRQPRRRVLTAHPAPANLLPRANLDGQAGLDFPSAGGQPVRGARHHPDAQSLGKGTSRRHRLRRNAPDAAPGWRPLGSLQRPARWDHRAEPGDPPDEGRGARDTRLGRQSQYLSEQVDSHETHLPETQQLLAGPPFQRAIAVPIHTNAPPPALHRTTAWTGPSGCP